MVFRSSILSWIITLFIPIITSLFLAKAGIAKTLEIEIFRTHEGSSCTTGELYVDGKFIAHTLELPWKNNQSFVSSIPTGTYSAFLRYDKSDRWRLQFKNVPHRSGVQIHIGNWPSQIQGCVLVGRKVINSKCSLEDSTAAYKSLKGAFYGSSNPVSSPDVKVEATVKYHPQETRFSYGGSVLQKSGTDWRISEREFVYKELFRTMKYIYVKPNGGPFKGRFIRWGIHGGVFQLKHETKNKWKTFDLNLGRRY